MLLLSLLRLSWRFFITGQSLRGKPTDNATFLHAASTDLRGRPYEKLSGPIWQRLAWRWAVLGFPLLCFAMSGAARVGRFLSDTDPWWTRYDWAALALRWWIIGALTVLGYGVYRIVRSIQTREVTREFVRPAWEAACDAMGHRYRESDAPRMVELPDDFVPPDIDPKPRGRLSAWIHARLERDTEELPEDDEDTSEPSTELVLADTPGEMDTYKPPPWQRILPKRQPADHDDLEDEPVRITLPPGKCATTAERNRFCQKVGPVLGMPDPKASWVMRGRSPYVELRTNRPPPPELTFAEIKKHLGGADIERPVIGLSNDGVEVVDMVNDSPHVLISAASGTGKTNLIKFLLCQRMHLGSALVVLDTKLVSHRWAHNLPGCDYAWEIPEIHDLLVAVAAEIHKRKKNAIPAGADVDTPLNRFDTLDILVEEQNALADQLRDYWTANRKPGQPLQSPAFTALKSAIFTGREFGVHVWSVAQMGAANTFGSNGGAARESFSSRIMSRWSVQAWKMLAGGIPFVRCPVGGPGIFAIIQATGESAIVRVPKISDRQARDWATSGAPSPGLAVLGEVIDETGAPVKVDIQLVDPEFVTLRAAAEGNMLPGPPISHDALRKASQRDSRFPEPDGGLEGLAILYRLEDLRAWKDARDGGGRLSLIGPRRGVVYRIDTLDPETGDIELGYIGQTRQKLSKREDQHRGDKPWSDLIVGSPIAIWEHPSCTNEELDEAEREAIRRLKPRYNYKEQEGAPHAMPLWEQEEQRQLRQLARGLPPWVPEDRYQMSQLAQMSQAGMR